MWALFENTPKRTKTGDKSRRIPRAEATNLKLTYIDAEEGQFRWILLKIFRRIFISFVLLQLKKGGVANFLFLILHGCQVNK